MVKSSGVLILAGGLSSRMDFPKPWLRFDDQNSYLEHLVNLYIQTGVNEVIVVINSDFCEKEWHSRVENLTSLATIIKNEQPELGRLHSVSLGLEKMRSDHAFIQNIDSPYIGKELIHALERNKLKNGTAIPIVNGHKGHPVLIGPTVKTCLLKDRSDNETLRDVLNNFEQKLVETDDEGILINVNTKSQYQKYSGRSIQ